MYRVQHGYPSLSNIGYFIKVDIHYGTFQQLFRTRELVISMYCKPIQKPGD